MKFVEYTVTPNKGTAIHGVAHKSRLEYLIQDGALIAELISDEAAAKLELAWGNNIEPAKAVKASKAA